MHRELTLEVLPQPDDETCGPTCLHAVYRFLGDDISLQQVIGEVTRLPTGGTLAAHLGVHALRRGHAATIYTYSLQLFDPTWFDEPAPSIAERLREQSDVKRSKRLRAATRAYLEFLDTGGMVRFEELGPDLIRRYLARGLPMLTGLSATYLYGCAREVWEGSVGHYDSVRGSPTGHYVVVHGYDPTSDSVLVADPFHANPLAAASSYRVGIIRLIGAIMLGALSNDANLLVIEPRKEAI